MAGTIIKFFTGTTEALAQLTQGQSQYIALNTQTREMYWNRNSIKYYMNYVSDWDVSDSTSPAFIKNKPQIPTIEELIDSLDISQISDSQNLITTYKQAIDPSEVVADGEGRYFLELTKRRPSDLITPNAMYSVQSQSLSVGNDNTLTIELSRYMAYQNVTSIPSTWKLLYA